MIDLMGLPAEKETVQKETHSHGVRDLESGSRDGGGEDLADYAHLKESPLSKKQYSALGAGSGKMFDTPAGKFSISQGPTRDSAFIVTQHKPDGRVGEQVTSAGSFEEAKKLLAEHAKPKKVKKAATAFDGMPEE